MQWCVTHRVLYSSFFDKLKPTDLPQWIAEFREYITTTSASKIHLIVDLSEDMTRRAKPKDLQNMLSNHARTGKVDQIIIIARNSALYETLKSTVGEYHPNTRIAASFESAVNYLKLIDASLHDVEWLEIET